MFRVLGVYNFVFRCSFVQSWPGILFVVVSRSIRDSIHQMCVNCRNVLSFWHVLLVSIHILFTHCFFGKFCRTIYKRCKIMQFKSVAKTLVCKKTIQTLVKAIFISKVIIHKSHAEQFWWNSNWGLGWIWVGYTANVYRQTTDKLMFKSVISTVRWIRK